MTGRPASRAVWAVVPVKRFEYAKSRLGGVLSPAARRDLAVAMLADVLDALRATAALEGVVVVTAQTEAAMMARTRGFDAIDDPMEAGVNAAVAAGLAYVQSRQGAALVTPADIPLVTSAEIGEAIDVLERSAVAIAPAARDGGTDLLALARADLIAPSFGPDSAASHAAAARARGVEPAFLALAGATRDIDTPEDLAALRRIGERWTRPPLACFRALSTVVPRRRSKKGGAMTNSFLAELPPEERLSREQAEALVEGPVSETLLDAAARRRDAGHGALVSYSRKVFIPLTKLCRDVCHYCTFAARPRRGERAFLTPDETLAIAEAGRRAGCKEALFTLGDKPELRYRRAREELRALGHETTLGYLVEMARLVQERAGLLPHINAGVMGEQDIASLRSVSVSQGLMLESSSERLCERGQPHCGSPDKVPRTRLETIAAAGRQAAAFTSGFSSASARRGGNASTRCSLCVTATTPAATSRKSSCRTSGPNRARAWPGSRRRRSTI